jgi:hypothetical protein
MQKTSGGAIFLIIASLLVGDVQAVVISDTPITFGLSPIPPFPPLFTTHRAVVIQSLNDDYTETSFRYDGTTLGVTTFLIDEGADWYLVNEAAPLTAATISSGQFTPLLSGNTIHPPISLPLGVFYLGVNTGIGFGAGNRAVFGWLKLDNTGTTLKSISNAMAYGEQGIYVGTTTAVPEPGAGAGAACVCVALLSARGSLRHRYRVR